MREPRLVEGTRNGRYGEVLLAFLEGAELRLEVYNSYVLNDCPQELWEKLDATQIALETGAVHAVLNGPRYWLMDGIGKIENVEPIIRDFGGIQMRRAATIILDGPMERAPYKDVTVNRGAIWFFDQGTDTFQLRAPDGRRFVMQAYCVGVDPTLTIETLHDLGTRLNLPSGWTYSVEHLTDDLKIDTTGHYATVLQDELENTYTLIA